MNISYFSVVALLKKYKFKWDTNKKSGVKVELKLAEREIVWTFKNWNKWIFPLFGGLKCTSWTYLSLL